MDSDLDYLRTAYKYAVSYSEDPNTQNGAVLLLTDGSVHLGTNRIPPPVRRSPERLESPEKYSWIEHAERDAIMSACRAGESTLGGTLYCPWFACADCARAIIQSGVREVVGHSTTMSRTPDRWAMMIEKAFVMFREAGVTTRIVSGVVGLSVRFDGFNLKV